MLPPLSIVIPSFNQGQFIERTILSILKQDYPGEVQVIVSDGGSSDETVDVLRRYPQVRWWSEQDEGIADGTNKGLTVATGEIVAIQSSDDYYLPNALRVTAEFLEEHGELALASGCDVYLQPDGRTFACSPLDEHEVTARSLMLRRVLPQHATFFRRAVIDRIGLLNTDLAEGAEIDFWYRALHHFAGRFIPRHTAVYQVHDAQRTKTGTRWLKSVRQMVEWAEQDETLGAIFRLSEDDKFNLYLRLNLQDAARAGHDAEVRAMLEIARNDARVTGETRHQLALHGLLPRPARPADAAPHPNHAIPLIDWWQQEWRRRAAA